MVDAVIISHFHLDHIGALPYFTEVSTRAGDHYLQHKHMQASPLRHAAPAQTRSTPHATSHARCQPRPHPAAVLHPLHHSPSAPNPQPHHTIPPHRCAATGAPST
jgi:metal-dependent hydrolase (beta-lactamase superfamily II)